MSKQLGAIEAPINYSIGKSVASGQHLTSDSCGLKYVLDANALTQTEHESVFDGNTHSHAKVTMMRR